MKNATKLRIALAVISCTLGAGIASAQREAREQNVQQGSVTSVHAFVEKWQHRILTENLAVGEPQTWGLRNLPKFAAFSAERLAVAMRAENVGELESLLVTAPVSHGMRLKTLIDAKPGNVALDALPGRGAVTKNEPSSNPTLYDDLAFTVVSPCRMFDSRLSGAGTFFNGVSQVIQVGPYPAAGGGYSTGPGAQGGSASGCGLDTLSGGDGSIAAIMVAVSSFGQSAAGYLTFYPKGAADPSATVVSMFYTAGPVQTAFVLIPTDMSFPVTARGISRGANTAVTMDVVGYFEIPKGVALNCQPTYVVQNVPAGATFNMQIPNCAAGFTMTGAGCAAGTFGGVDWVINGLYPITPSTMGGYCAGTNTNGVTVPIDGMAQCCKSPGR